MSDLAFALPLLLAALFLVGALMSGIRFVNSGANPRTIAGLVINAGLALLFGWMAWVAWSGVGFP